MAEKDKDKKEGDEEEVKVPMSVLVQLQETVAELEKKVEEEAGKRAGLEELFATQAKTEGDKTLRVKKNFEPKFRTVRVRKYPIAGDLTNLGYIVGWTNKGAYQEVDRSGVRPEVVDFIDVIFLGQEKTKEGKIKAEKVRLLDLFNNGIQVHCKILKVEKNDRIEPTGEEIEVSIYDPNHGMISTGEKIDGYVVFSDLQYMIQIPGVEGSTTIDAKFLN